jgi:hypothetical protein
MCPQTRLPPCEQPARQVLPHHFTKSRTISTRQREAWLAYYGLFANFILSAPRPGRLRASFGLASGLVVVVLVTVVDNGLGLTTVWYTDGMDDASGLGRPGQDNDQLRHTLTVHEVGERLSIAQVPRSERQIKRYCESGFLDAKKFQGPPATNGSWPRPPCQS